MFKRASFILGCILLLTSLSLGQVKVTKGGAASYRVNNNPDNVTIKANASNALYVDTTGSWLLPKIGTKINGDNISSDVVKNRGLWKIVAGDGSLSGLDSVGLWKHIDELDEILVTDYGAVGDGVTNDYGVFYRVSRNFLKDNMRIVFPPKVYKVNINSPGSSRDARSVFRIYGKKNVFIDARGAKFIFDNDKYNTVFLIDSCENVIILGGEIVGPNVAAPAVYGGHAGIEIVGSKNVWVEGWRIYGISSHGILIHEKQNDRIFILHNSIESCGSLTSADGHGIGSSDIKNSIYAFNIIKDIRNRGIEIYNNNPVRGNVVTNVKVFGNIVQNVGDNMDLLAVFSDDGSNPKIDSIFIYNNVFIGGASTERVDIGDQGKPNEIGRIFIENNWIFNALLTVRASKPVTIRGNKIIGGYGWLIQKSGTTFWNRFIGNHIENSTKYGFNFDSVKVVVANNTVESVNVNGTELLGNGAGLTFGDGVDSVIVHGNTIYNVPKATYGIYFKDVNYGKIIANIIQKPSNTIGIDLGKTDVSGWDWWGNTSSGKLQGFFSVSTADLNVSSKYFGLHIPSNNPGFYKGYIVFSDKAGSRVVVPSLFKDYKWEDSVTQYTVALWTFNGHLLDRSTNNKDLYVATDTLAFSGTDYEAYSHTSVLFDSSLVLQRPSSDSEFNITSTDQFTLTVRLYVPSGSSVENVTRNVITKGGNFYLQVNSDGTKTYARFYIYDGSNARSLVGTSNLDGGWHKIVVSHSPSITYLRVDGVNEASSSTAFGGFSNSNALMVGGYTTTLYPLEGRVDYIHFEKGIAR